MLVRIVQSGIRPPSEDRQARNSATDEANKKPLAHQGFFVAMQKLKAAQRR